MEEAEELAARAKRKFPPIADPEAWDGDEPQMRAIKRILADQYKPLKIKVNICPSSTETSKKLTARLSL